MKLNLSQHARTRVQQRGFYENDPEIIYKIGTLVDDSMLLTNKDVDHAIREHKREIEILERLRGCRVVVGESGNVITIYNASRKTQKRLLRGTHNHKKPQRWVLPNKVRNTT